MGVRVGGQIRDSDPNGACMVARSNSDAERAEVAEGRRRHPAGTLADAWAF
jgi:hypothetical protein